ncbi:MAG: pentapeptide repeat-containing protein [Rhodobacteraceae bacterium]|nr:pentapeptide repeat-containing protein [Paracoccaceae bacterium]
MSKDTRPNVTLTDWLGVSNAPNWRVARHLGPLLTVVVAVLFVLALGCAFVVLGRTVFWGGEVSLGVGGLVVALLGAPFVIWGTVLKHQTVMFQKEGHMTDRINKAVEQLGAEKEVRQLGRNISIRTKRPEGYEEVERLFVFKGDEFSYVDGDDVLVEPWEEVTLSAPNIEVRIGAILSLERIAQDSTRHDKGRDHVRVMEILCAYIRENSNDQKPRNYTKQDWSPLENDATAKMRDDHLSKLDFHCRFVSGKIQEWIETLPKLRVDVQLALSVIGRRNTMQRQVEAAWPYPASSDTVWPFDLPCPELTLEPDDEALSETELDTYFRRLQAWRETLDAYQGYRLDLRGANLQRADLSSKQFDGSDAVFSGALFENARLEGANLRWAQMKGADFDEAHLTGTKIGPAHLQGAAFKKAHLQGADLMGVEMQGVNLRDAFIQGANLYESRMEGASLVGALVEGADFTLARLQGTSFWRARMAGVDCSVARMEGVKLTDADIRKADFSDTGMERVYLRRVQIDDQTYFRGAKLEGAAFANVNLTSASVTQEQVSVAFGDASVELPKGLERPPNWPLDKLKIHIGKNSFPREWRKWRENPDTYKPPAKPQS